LFKKLRQITMPAKLHNNIQIPTRLKAIIQLQQIRMPDFPHIIEGIHLVLNGLVHITFGEHFNRNNFICLGVEPLVD
jgi:hypothetical protein